MSLLYAYMRAILSAEPPCKGERDLAGAYSIVTLEVSLWKEEGCLYRQHLLRVTLRDTFCLHSLPPQFLAYSIEKGHFSQDTRGSFEHSNRHPTTT